MSINSRSDLWHLADALSEDILNTGADDLFAEVAEDHQDRRTLVIEFDRISGRGLRRVRRRERIGATEAIYRSAMARSQVRDGVHRSACCYRNCECSLSRSPPLQVCGAAADQSRQWWCKTHAADWRGRSTQSCPADFEYSKAICCFIAGFAGLRPRGFRRGGCPARRAL